MSPEERFERIGALLHGVADRENRMEARFIRDHERAMAGMDKAEARMDKFDKQLQATRKLVEAGMKMLVRLSADVREVSRIQKDMLRFRGNGQKARLIGPLPLAQPVLRRR